MILILPQKLLIEYRLMQWHITSTITTINSIHWHIYRSVLHSIVNRVESRLKSCRQCSPLKCRDKLSMSKWDNYLINFSSKASSRHGLPWFTAIDFFYNHYRNLMQNLILDQIITTLIKSSLYFGLIAYEMRKENNCSKVAGSFCKLSNVTTTSQ